MHFYTLTAKRWEKVSILYLARTPQKWRGDVQGTDSSAITACRRQRDVSLRTPAPLLKRVQEWCIQQARDWEIFCIAAIPPSLLWWLVKFQVKAEWNSAAGVGDFQLPSFQDPPFMTSCVFMLISFQTVEWINWRHTNMITSLPVLQPPYVCGCHSRISLILFFQTSADVYL